MARGWIDKRYIISLCDLRAEIIAALIGSIEVQTQGVLGLIVYQCAAVRAQACAVANYALGIETYFKYACSHDFFEKCLNTKRTITKFVGTAIINTAKGANSR